MTYSQTLLNDLKAAKDGCSDYKAAQIIGCSKQHISRVKSGIKNFSPEVVIMIATETGKDPLEAMLERLIESAENPKVRQTIKEIKQRIQ
jgi:transcriptional regulator with XRE-family HTH domain